MCENCGNMKTKDGLVTSTYGLKQEEFDKIRKKVNDKVLRNIIEREKKMQTDGQ